ncbi:MAG TPA: hypothetical protein VFH43_02535, partial [Candidatus Kapabacteria bacterium]|nr:hypothetical protein [Candidatus Kapabacteria bacterium]
MKFQKQPSILSVTLAFVFALVLALLVPLSSSAQSQLSKARIIKPQEGAVDKGKVKTYTRSVEKPIISVETRNTTAKWVTQIKIDLGPAFVSAADQRVENGLGQTFSSVSWAALTQRDLPSGAAVVYPGKAGEPAIPYLSFSVAVPAGALELTSRHSIVKSSDIGTIKLLPLPRRLNDTASIREYSALSYETAKADLFKTVGPARMRQLTMVQVMVPLVEFNASGASKAVERLNVELSYSAPASRGAFTDKHFIGFYNSLVVNSNDVRRFAAGYHA